MIQMPAIEITPPSPDPVPSIPQPQPQGLDTSAGPSIAELPQEALRQLAVVRWRGLSDAYNGVPGSSSALDHGAQVAEEELERVDALRAYFEDMGW
jgi:hypothetical protein